MNLQRYQAFSLNNQTVFYLACINYQGSFTYGFCFERLLFSICIFAINFIPTKQIFKYSTVNPQIFTTTNTHFILHTISAEICPLSQREVLGEGAVDKVQAQSNSGRYNSIVVLSSKSHSSLFNLQIRVDFHYIQANQFSMMRHYSNNRVAFNGIQPSPELGACSSCEHGVNGINIEGYMEGFITLRIKVLNSLTHNLPDSQLGYVVHCEAFDIVLFEIDPFIGVDVSDRNQYHILEGNPIHQPLESWDTLGESSDM